jgi:hypothetical protein
MSLRLCGKRDPRLARSFCGFWYVSSKDIVFKNSQLSDSLYTSGGLRATGKPVS